MPIDPATDFNSPLSRDPDYVWDPDQKRYVVRPHVPGTHIPDQMSTTAPRTSEVLGGGYWSDYFNNKLGSPPPETTLQTGNTADSRSRQDALLQQLHGIASGRDKSPAEIELQSLYQSAASRAWGGASATRDVGAGQSRRLGMDAMGGLGLSQNSDQEVLRAQQQQQAAALLAQLYGSQYGQDTTQANLGAESELMNREATDRAHVFNVGGGLQSALNNHQLGMDIGRSNLGYNEEQRGINNDLVRTGLQGAGSLASWYEGLDLSDPKDKERQRIEDAFNG